MTEKLIGVPQDYVEDMVRVFEHLASKEPEGGEGRTAYDYRFKANELRNLLVKANYRPPQAEAVWARLEQPAKVGATRFGTGVSTRLVVEAAQRLHAYDVTPEKEVARIARANVNLADLRQRLGLEGEQGAWLQPQQDTSVAPGESLILPARRPDDYRSPRTRDAWNECIDETIQLNGHLAQMAANARRYEKIRALVGKDQLTLSIEHDCYTQYVDSGDELDSSIDRLVDGPPAPADVDDHPGQPYQPAKDMRAADWAAVLPSSALPASDLVAIEALSGESNAQ